MEKSNVNNLNGVENFGHGFAEADKLVANNIEPDEKENTTEEVDAEGDDSEAEEVNDF